MLDDIFDVFSDLMGGNNVNRLTGQRGKRTGRSAASDRPLPKRQKQQTKLTARRDRRGGEDPWDWKEEKPPWEF